MAKGELDYGTVMAVVSLQISVSTMVQRFGSSLTTLSASLVKAGRVFDFLEMEGEEASVVAEVCRDNDSKRTCEQEENQRAGEMTETPIEVRNLCFGYEGKQTVLKDISMLVSKGEKILLMENLAAERVHY